VTSLGVNIAILDNYDRLLPTGREDFDVWSLSGGGVEAGETLTQAARRETQEETGLREFYAMRDSSGLSPAAFYRQHFRPVQPEYEVDELGVESC
jgi:ADP-ribose pyrophosphatase YjhB (NUDIX family)